jgi:hypothetical protein
MEELEEDLPARRPLWQRALLAAAAVGGGAFAFIGLGQLYALMGGT